MQLVYITKKIIGESLNYLIVIWQKEISLQCQLNQIGILKELKLNLNFVD